MASRNKKFVAVLMNPDFVKQLDEAVVAYGFKNRSDLILFAVRRFLDEKKRGEGVENQEG